MDKAAMSVDGYVENKLTENLSSVNITEDEWKWMMNNEHGRIAGFNVLNAGDHAEVEDDIAQNQSIRRGNSEIKTYSVCARNENCIRSYGKNTAFIAEQTAFQPINGKNSNQNCRKRKRSVSTDR